ncbi:MAG: hypothetical protein II163_07490 [Ruminococcus sp.]|nr:hypothetical protein [Ruminococcus sp.]MBQ4239004.1 hypothetical protein [Ruminococcus sp.]
MNPNKIVWSEEKEKLKRLPFKEKIRYIWTYFWIPIVAILFVLIFGTFLIVRISTNIPDNWLMVTFANTTAQAGTGSQLWEDFTEHTGYDLKQKKVEFNAESYFDYLKDQAKGNAYYNAFVTLADVGELDAITMESASLAALGQSGRLFDLNDEKCADLKAKYADRFVYYTPTDENGKELDPIPVGIDISDSLLVTKYHLYVDSCALGVGAHSENIKEVGDFLSFVLGEG